MTKQPLVVIIGVLLLLTGCHTRDKYATSLDEAEELMEEKTEKADSLLQQLSSEVNEMNKTSRMKYLMLMADVGNKLDNQTISDSLFQEVIDFYDNHGTNSQQVKTRYLMGCIYRDLHEAPMALQWYLEAVNKADTLASDCDNSTLIKIYGQMAYIYNDQMMPIEEMDCYKRFCHYAKKINNRYLEIRGIEKQLEVYHYLGDTTNILSLTDSVHDLFMQENMPKAAASVYPSVIYVYLAQKNYTKAKQLMDIFEHQSGLFEEGVRVDEVSCNYNCAKGLYYQGINKPDSAAFYYKQLLLCGNKLTAYNGLFSVYSQENMMDSATKYCILYRDAIDDNTKTQQQEAMTKVNAMYDYSRNQRIAQQKEIELIHRNNIIIYIIIGVTILAIFLSLWYAKKKRAIKKEMQKKEFLYQENLRKARYDLEAKEKELANFSQKFDKKEDELRQVEKNAQNELNKKDDEIAKIKEEELRLRNNVDKAKKYLDILESSTANEEKISEEMESLMYKDSIVERFHHYAKSGYLAQKVERRDWDELQKSIQNHVPRLCSLIIHNYELTDEQKKITFLVRLKFGNGEIMNLLNIKNAQIVNYRLSRINMLLYDEKGAAHLLNNLRKKLPK